VGEHFIFSSSLFELGQTLNQLGPVVKTSSHNKGFISVFSAVGELDFV
jgi:hypothetical protein